MESMAVLADRGKSSMLVTITPRRKTKQNNCEFSDPRA